MGDLRLNHKIEKLNTKNDVKNRFWYIIGCNRDTRSHIMNPTKTNSNTFEILVNMILSHQHGTR